MKTSVTCFLLDTDMKRSRGKIDKSKLWILINKSYLKPEKNKFLKSTFQLYIKRLVESYLLARFLSYTSLKQGRILMKAFIEVQFDYCPLIRMFYVREVNIKINHLIKYALQIEFRNRASSFHKLLAKTLPLLFILELSNFSLLNSIN